MPIPALNSQSCSGEQQRVGGTALVHTVGVLLFCSHNKKGRKGKLQTCARDQLGGWAQTRQGRLLSAEEGPRQRRPCPFLKAGYLGWGPQTQDMDREQKKHT